MLGYLLLSCGCPIRRFSLILYNPVLIICCSIYSLPFSTFYLYELCRAFGIPMGLGGHAIMWKNMVSYILYILRCAFSFRKETFDYVDVPYQCSHIDIYHFFIIQMAATYIERMTADTMDILNCLSWYTTLIAAGFISLCYVYKMCTSFALVKAEWLNETRVHFHNCPNLIFLMLLIGLPKHINASDRSLRVMWGLSFCYQTLMTYYIYKAWMFSPSRNITVARPQFLLSTTGWFLLSVL